MTINYILCFILAPLSLWIGLLALTGIKKAGLIRMHPYLLFASGLGCYSIDLGLHPAYVDGITPWGLYIGSVFMVGAFVAWGASERWDIRRQSLSVEKTPPGGHSGGDRLENMKSGRLLSRGRRPLRQSDYVTLFALGTVLAIAVWLTIAIRYAHQESLYITLWSAAAECNPREVRDALKRGADPNFDPDSKYGTPLHEAQTRGQGRASSQECAEVIRLLKQAGEKK